MKKFALVFAVIFCLTIPAFAADSFTTTFTWNQPNETDVQYIALWRCQETTTQQVVEFPNTGGTGPFQATSNFTLTGEPGQSVTHNYRIQAVANDGFETAWSNELPKTYVLTGAQVGTPVLILVE